MYYFIPQHAWGLVTIDEPGPVIGFYSAPGGPCQPVALVCQTTHMGAFAHWDVPQMLTESLLDWMTGDNHGNVIDVYTTADTQEEVLAQIQALGFTGQAQAATGAGIWGFTFVGGVGAIDVEDIPEADQVEAPASWSSYWPGAPDWEGTSTFNNLIIDNTNGFFANYNGSYYLDFG